MHDSSLSKKKWANGAQPMGVRLTTRTNGSRTYPEHTVLQSPTIAIAGCAVAYYIATCLGPLLGSGPDRAAVFQLPDALLLAILLRLPRARWWAMLLAIVLVYLIAGPRADITSGEFFWQLAFSVALPLVTAVLFRLCVGEGDPFGEPRRVAIYGLIAGLLTPAAMAWVAPGVFDALLQFREGTSVGVAWSSRYLSEAVSFIALTPVFVLWGARHVKREREHREGEIALARASRIVAAGEISLAVAHEINQPLGAILNNAETGLYLLDSPAMSREELKAILTDIRNDNLRAAEAVRSIRALLQERERECESVDLNRLVAETVKLVSMRARQQGVELETVLEPITLVYADPIQLQQVLLNLLLNALDALEGSRIDPYIWIRTSTVGRGHVEVRVIDTGSGIPPEHLEKIFEPFHTSKREGMGLGLSIVRSIIEAHEGKVTAENNKRRPGATFRFVLPAVPRAARARRQRARADVELSEND